MPRKTTSRLIIALAITTFISGTGSVLAGEIQLEFGTFNAFEMTEQDVFIDAGNETVKRIPAADVSEMMDAPLYGATVSPPFQPLNMEPTETYGKGIDLGLTLRQWLSASGSGTVACENGQAVVDVSLSGLAPNAVYTMWNFIDAEPPTDPWQGILYPLGARDGSDATFRSDAEGNAQYRATFEPCLQPSGTQTMAGIAAAWHPDGKTHGASPGALGVDSFAQLMTALIE